MAILPKSTKAWILLISFYDNLHSCTNVTSCPIHQVEQKSDQGRSHELCAHADFQSYICRTIGDAEAHILILISICSNSRNNTHKFADADFLSATASTETAASK